MSGIEVRFIDPTEVREWLRAEQRSFGIEPDDKRLDELLPGVEVPRSVAALDGGAIVATGAAYTTAMTLPGGAVVPVGGVTAIGTRPTHTRNGLFRRVIDVLHEQSAELGEPAAVLLASEAALYPRFGYGLATQAAWVQLDRRRVSFRPDADISDRLEMFHDVADSDDLVAELWHRAGADRPGWLHRPPALRHHVLADHQVDRHGAMPFTMVVHHDHGGRPDGYCLYRRRLQWEQGQSTGTLFIAELVTASDAARLSLWNHCLSIDLVETIEAMPIPTDDPLPEALVDRRQFRTIGLLDQVWIRTHDPSALLEARRYASSDAIVVDIDEIGAWRITGGPDGAEVVATRSASDLSMGRAELGSLMVGNSLRPLVATNRVKLTDSADLDRLDRFFHWPVAPYNLLDF